MAVEVLTKRTLGGPHPSAWRTMLCSAFALGALWTFSTSSFLFLRPLSHPIGLLFCCALALLFAFWFQWFPMNHELAKLAQRVIGISGILATFIGSGLMFLLMLVHSTPDTLHSWELSNDVHVDFQSGSDFIGQCPSLQLRFRSGLLSQGWKIGNCEGDLKPIAIPRAAKGCSVSAPERFFDAPDLSLITFTPQCRAVKRK
jgi:hypothetical protein